MPLFSVDEILRFPPGRCVITNPGYSSGGEGSIPYPLTIPIPKSDLKRKDESEKLWDTHVRTYLESRVKLASLEQLTDALYERIEEAERMLPLPDEVGNVPPTSSPKGESGTLDALDSVVPKRKNFTRRVFAPPQIGSR